MKNLPLKSMMMIEINDYVLLSMIMIKRRVEWIFKVVFHLEFEIQLKNRRYKEKKDLAFG